MGRVAGKIAIVTGAASGIGRACARRLAEEGALVVLTDRAVDAGEAAAAALGAPHAFRPLDVTDAEAWTRVVDEVARMHGRLDVLVNAAGIAVMNDIESATLAEWRTVHAVNGEGTFLGCQAAVRAMKATGGSIINVSSVAGLVADPDMAVYCASKGSVRLLTKAVALHAARAGYGIRCNSVHPAFIDTPMVDAVLAPAAATGARTRAKLERAIPLGRLGQPDEVADLVVYLASDESRFVTGAELVIDGGLTAR